MTRKKRKIARKMSRKSVRKAKPMKIAALVVSAIQDLRETKGSTHSKIVGYINYSSDMPEGRVKRQVKAALKRGVEYGILRRYRGHYFLPTGDEWDRANRVAVRFAKLPLPTANSAKSTAASSRKARALKNYQNLGKLGTKSATVKRLANPRPNFLSSTASLIKQFYADGIRDAK